MPRKSNIEEKILKTSEDLFYKHGFVKASIRDIATAVGISKSTGYIYFTNKDEILFRIIIGSGKVLLEELQGVIDQYDDPLECLRALIFRHIVFSIENYKRTKIYLEEQYQLPVPLKRQARVQHRQIYDLYFRKVCELEEKGLLKDLNNTSITFSIFAMISWVYRWFKRGGQLSLDEVAENQINILFGGILKNRKTSN